MFNDRSDLTGVFIMVAIVLVVIIAIGAIIGISVTTYQKRKRNSANIKVQDSEEFLRRTREEIRQERGARIDTWED